MPKKYEEHNYKDFILTFLLGNTLEHNQEIPDHLFCFALYVQ